MKAKPIRLCVECGKEHNSEIKEMIKEIFEPLETCSEIKEMIKEIFEPLETCIDCLMRKRSFKPVKNLTLEDVEPMTYDDMQLELGKTVLPVLQSEYGAVGNVDFSECKMCNADGEET